MLVRKKRDKEKEKKNNTLCELSFILGVMSFFFSSMYIFPLLAVVFGIWGLSRYKNSKHKNRWKAYWGIFFGIILALTNFV